MLDSATNPFQICNSVARLAVKTQFGMQGSMLNSEVSQKQKQNSKYDVWLKEE